MVILLSTSTCLKNFRIKSSAHTRKTHNFSPEESEQRVLRLVVELTDLVEIHLFLNLDRSFKQADAELAERTIAALRQLGVCPSPFYPDEIFKKRGQRFPAPLERRI